MSFRLLATVAIACGGLASCSDRLQPTSLVTERSGVNKPVLAANATTEKTQLEYGDVIAQEKSEYGIIPVGYRLKEKKRTSYTGSSSSYSASSSRILKNRALAVVNLIFHGHKNNQTHLLLEKNAFITEFDYLVNARAVPGEINPNSTTSACKLPENTPEDHTLNWLLFYQIAEQDTNRNQVLDSDDASKGYLSDLSGKNLRSVTPDLTKLDRYFCDDRRDRLLLFVRELNTSQSKVNPLVLYTYSLSDRNLKRITPTQSNLENWKITLADGSMYLFSRVDSNGDKQYTSADETSVIKYNLDTETALEINNPQIRQQLAQ